MDTGQTKRNTYKFFYTHTPDSSGTAAPATLSLTITASGLTAQINKNDLLGGI